MTTRSNPRASKRARGVPCKSESSPQETPPINDLTAVPPTSSGLSSLLASEGPSSRPLLDAEPQESLKQVQRRIIQLQSELFDASGRGTTRSRPRYRSPSSESEPDLNSTRVIVLHPNSSLQRRQLWLSDLQHVFRAAPKRHKSDERKIITAYGFLDRACRQRLVLHINEKTPEAKRHAQTSWEYFANWTLTLVKNPPSYKADIARQRTKASQLPNQDPREFNTYLESMEQHFPR